MNRQSLTHPVDYRPPGLASTVQGSPAVGAGRRPRDVERGPWTKRKTSHESVGRRRAQLRVTASWASAVIVDVLRS
jgi:hypothetical protein